MTSHHPCIWLESQLVNHKMYDKPKTLGKEMS